MIRNTSKRHLPTTHNYPLSSIDACIQVRDKDKNLGDVVIQSHILIYFIRYGRPIELYSCRLTEIVKDIVHIFHLVLSMNIFKVTAQFSTKMGRIHFTVVLMKS